MENKSKYLGILLVCNIVLIFILYTLWQNEKSAGLKKDTVIREKNAQIQYRENENGRIIAEKQAAVIRAKELEEAYPKIYESLKNDMDIKFKNLKAFVQNEFEARGSGTGSITNNHYYDSGANKLVRYQEFKMDDGYLKFSTMLFDSLVDEAPYTYTYADTAKTAIHAKKKWIFGKETLYASTMFSNPQAKITGTTNILVDNYRDKRWVISTGITVFPDFERASKIRVVPGVSIGYALIKF